MRSAQKSQNAFIAKVQLTHPDPALLRLAIFHRLVEAAGFGLLFCSSHVVQQGGRPEVPFGLIPLASAAGPRARGSSGGPYSPHEESRTFTPNYPGALFADHNSTPLSAYPHLFCSSCKPAERLLPIVPPASTMRGSLAGGELWIDRTPSSSV